MTEEQFAISVETLAEEAKQLIILTEEQLTIKIGALAEEAKQLIILAVHT